MMILHRHLFYSCSNSVPTVSTQSRRTKIHPNSLPVHNEKNVPFFLAHSRHNIIFFSYFFPLLFCRQCIF